MRKKKMTRQEKIDLWLSRYKTLSKAEQKALDAIGNHRKTKCPIGKGKRVSTRTYNSLVKRELVMPQWDGKPHPMLTLRGEMMWTALHPTSKYREY